MQWPFRVMTASGNEQFEIPQPAISKHIKIIFKNHYLKFHLNLSGANELAHWALEDLNEIFELICQAISREIALR